MELNTYATHTIIAELNGILYEQSKPFLIVLIEPCGKKRLFALIATNNDSHDNCDYFSDLTELLKTLIIWGGFNQDILEERYGFHFGGWRWKNK